MTIDLTLNPEFKVACDLLYLKPEEVIDAFMSNISLPYFCSTKVYMSSMEGLPNVPLRKLDFADGKHNSRLVNPVKMLATNFLLTFCSIYNERFLPAKNVQEKYIKKYKKLMLELKAEKNADLRCFRLMCFYSDWHQELINNLSDKDVIINTKSRIKPKPRK
ncbi:hypothetical protein SAMN05421827_102252 [Pedobacter terrae]|uniref:Uncharacterized protein n=1 Tax=Pedobacter terrae TaxID=405671 RepID=A0A1G7QBT3_9SPHI|nr:hypothetical protein [Pedobacter terrae]SDF95992.1 hypothetical protein SAMN05421827_102252 [Pedobacter terrae]